MIEESLVNISTQALHDDMNTQYVSETGIQTDPQASINDIETHEISETEVHKQICVIWIHMSSMKQELKHIHKQ